MTKTTKMQVAQPTLKEELNRRAMGAREECQMVIQNDHDYTAADRKISEVAALAKAVKDFWHPLKRAARVSWELLRENEKGMLGPIEAGVETLTDTMKRYRAERERRDRERQEAEQLLQIEEAQVATFEMAEQGAPQEAIDAVEEMITEPPFQANPTQELRGRTGFKPDYKVTIEDIDQVDREFLLPSTKAHMNAIIANAKARAIKTGGKPIAGFTIIETESATVRRVK